MFIINENRATRRLYNEDIVDEPVEFASTGTAQVSRDVGEAMIAYYDDIRRKE
ncbi:hypothetical protein [Natrinema sp. H-ect4]|uniref:hypothetical protein n=1 Tax=Natrinema sp. H-ect4 TaxID=3242699 RepID=UPI0035A826DE